ncbi:MAG: hemerythrin domain-containing protein [Polyangiaceae bacterium]
MKRDPRLHGLSSEHHHSLVLVQRIRAWLSRADVETEQAFVDEVFARYSAELEPHFAAEEELLLPDLTSGIEKDFALRTASEHQMMRELAKDAKAGQLDALRAFADVLEAHVRFEEQQLYPLCERVIPDERLTEVARRVPKSEPR